MEPGARAEEKASFEVPPARRPAARGEGDRHAPDGVQAGCGEGKTTFKLPPACRPKDARGHGCQRPGQAKQLQRPAGTNQL